MRFMKLEGERRDGTIVVKYPSEDELLAGLVFKLQHDAYVDVLAFVRVYAGVLKSGQKVYNPRKRKSEKISKLLKLHANSWT